MEINKKKFYASSSDLLIMFDRTGAMVDLAAGAIHGGGRQDELVADFSGILATLEPGDLVSWV